MRKKFLWVLLACVMAFSLAAFTACEADMTDEDTVRATGVTLNETSISLAVGEQFQLTATPTPENATDPITWHTSDKSIAEVTQDGLVTAVSLGTVEGATTATVTITVQIYTAKATCTVTVTPAEDLPAESVVLPDTASVEKGSTTTLSATVLPQGTTDEVEWTIVSGDAYVDITPSSDGLTCTVEGVAAGSAVIRATAGDFSDTCIVTVTDNGGGTEPEPPAYTKLVGYSVQDNAFTDGETAVSDGTIENGGFKASDVNLVYVENPYYNETVTSASIVVEFYIGSATLEDWAPLWGIKDSGNGFLALVVNGDTDQLQLSYNAYSPVGTDNNYFDQSLGAPTVGTHTLLISIAEDGSLDIYYDNGTAPLASIDLDDVYNVAEGDTYAASGETVGEYLLQAERLYFFGGAWGELSVSGDMWTWTGLPWAGNFNGSIVSCDFYSGIIPVSDVFGA